MNLNINLFVHGVPLGQKIWGHKGDDDERYLSSFYGPKWDAPEVMKIDIMTIGGITRCYYSYVKGQNVFDSQGRAGSYIALTLRINAFYADVQNMYSILKAAYDKMCVGLCISESNDSVKFLLPDFQTIDTPIKEIENHILNYISKFSINTDIIDLNEFEVNGHGTVHNINLHECTKIVAIENLRKSGNLMVSPWFLSANAVKTLAQYKAEMQATKERAQQEIQIQKQTCQEKIDDLTKQFQDELNDSKEHFQKQIAQIKEDNEREIDVIKKQYVDIDEKIKKLKRTIKEREQQISDLKSQGRRKEKEIHDKQNDIQKLEKQISKNTNGSMELDEDLHQESESKPKIRHRIFVYIIIGIIIISAFVLLLFFTDYGFGNKIIDNLKPEENDEQSEVMTKEPFSIIVRGLSNPRDSIIMAGEDSIRVGDIYKVFVTSPNTRRKGKLESEEFTIQGEQLQAKRNSVNKFGRISYKIEGNEVASISFYIKGE